MKKVMTAAAVLGVAGAASATTIETQTLNFGFPLSPGNETLTFNQFDDLGGSRTLTRVELILDATVTGDATAENDSSLPAPNFTLDLTGLIDATFSTLSATAGINNQFAQALDASDNGGVANGSGPDFHDFGNVGGSDADDDNEFSSFASYIGTGTIDADVNGSAGFSFSGTTDATLGIDNLGATGTVTINYYWVPAPGAAALLGLGGLAAARRRR